MNKGLQPVHGFVLAGGKSSRMGVDKATLKFCKRPLVEIAVAKLREFCADVSIAGNRDDLSAFASVVREGRMESGPGVGIEAGLSATAREWAMFLPVDVPLVPAELLRAWVSAELEADAKENELMRSCGARLQWASHLVIGGRVQPALALLHRDCLGGWVDGLEAGKRSLVDLFAAIKAAGGEVRRRDAETFAPGATALELEVWFSNVNTAVDLKEAEAWAKQMKERGWGTQIPLGNDKQSDGILG